MGQDQVITLELAADDIAATRFSISPLHETVTSLFPMYVCGGTSHVGWVRDARRRPDIDHDLLRSLIAPSGCIPDFLTPPPLQSRPQISEQLDQVRATSAETVVAEVRTVFADGEVPPRLRRVDSDPLALRDAVADALEHYWEIVMVPHWSRMRAILEADLLYRGVQCAEVGAGAALDQLDPQITWTGDALDVDVSSAGGKRVPASGRGIQLIPSVFMPGPSLPVDVDSAQVLGYRSRRAGLMWQDMTPVASSAIRSLLGRRRASVLTSLDQPRSPTEIARLMAVTPGAVSQHLAVLSAARLVERARVGRVVLYSQSPLARQLLHGHAGADIEGLDLRGDLTA